MSRIPRFNPANIVKTKRDERLWQQATEAAAQQGQAGNYAYIMGTFKRMQERQGGVPGDFSTPGAVVYAKERRLRTARKNDEESPAWAEALGRGLYRAGHYTARSAKAIVKGIRDAHAKRRRNPAYDPVERALATLDDTSLDPDVAVNLANRILAGEEIAEALAGTGLVIDVSDDPPQQTAQIALTSGEVVDVPVIEATKIAVTDEPVRRPLAERFPSLQVFDLMEDVEDIVGGPVERRQYSGSGMMGRKSQFAFDSTIQPDSPQGQLLQGLGLKYDRAGLVVSDLGGVRLNYVYYLD